MTKLISPLPLGLLLGLLLAACSAEIGDDCSFDADCSQNLDRNCDSSQPGGYCLIIGCAPDECPHEAVCVEYTTPCPIGTSDESCQRMLPNRGRTYCVKHCKSEGDCRSNYQCIEPEEASAGIIDFDTNRTKICTPDSPE